MLGLSLSVMNRPNDHSNQMGPEKLFGTGAMQLQPVALSADQCIRTA